MTATDRYPLEVHCLYDSDGGGLCGFYSKGHHDPAAFVAAIVEADGSTWPVEDVRHGERRWEICCGPDDWVRCLNQPREGSGRRGIFPVTIVEW